MVDVLKEIYKGLDVDGSLLRQQVSEAGSEDLNDIQDDISVVFNTDYKLVRWGGVFLGVGFLGDQLAKKLPETNPLRGVLRFSSRVSTGMGSIAVGLGFLSVASGIRAWDTVENERSFRRINDDFNKI